MEEERSQYINNRDFAMVKWGTVIRWKLIINFQCLSTMISDGVIVMDKYL